MDKPGILSGYRIIDITTVVLGPFATLMLGDLGADVIKVEPPGGDIIRGAGPQRSPGMGPIFLTMNRNKRSITLDLKEPAARTVLERLIASADALIHNVRAAAIERLGFGYNQVRAIRPDIVYVHATGFGSNGPYAGRPAYDDLVQAASGMATMLPRQDGSEAPRYFPGLVADKTAGLYAANATLAGLLHRERTGKGQFIEVPMMECLVSFTMAENLYGHAFVPPTGQTGYARAMTPDRRPYRTKDGYVAVLPYTDAQWRAFFKAGGRPELADDPRFAAYRARSENIAEAYRLAAEILEERTTAEWLKLLEAANVPVMPVHTLESVLDDPQMRETGFIAEREHPREGTYLAIGQPLKFSHAPTPVRHEPPFAGQHTREILGELGFDEEEIVRMSDEGIFG